MRRINILAVFIILLAGCGGKKSNPSPPSAATLIFPDNNAVCITGTVISDAQNTVPFSWNSAANTNSYEVDVKNLLTGEITTHSSTQPGLTITLARNTPYSWFVVSKSNAVAGTAKSDTWKFYNSGPGVVSHPPFPATLLTPTFAQNINASGGQVTLTWDCSDVDNDLANYDVYLGTATTPPLLQSGVISKTLNANVTSGTIYYWMIVAKDLKGNTSTSDVFQFKVN
jgi:hypothetical protein